MAQYANYWSCSKVAKIILGLPKPSAATASEWKTWKKESKQKHPYRYWMAEEGLGYLQDFVYWPYNRFNDIRYYINNRWITKSHALTSHPSDIKRGNWQDLGYRILPCLFNELVDFVEIEQAYMNVIWDNDARKKYCVPWWRTSFFRWRTWRCPEAGIEYLDWAASLTQTESEGFYDKNSPEYGKPTQQAVSAIEIKSLYAWWKEIYPNRPDPYEISGWNELRSNIRNSDDFLDMFDRNESQSEKDERKKVYLKIAEIEQQYEQEDEHMMIRLIKVRHALWT